MMNPHATRLSYRAGKASGRPRRGAAVVEFAICIPVIFVVVLGAIECTTMIFVDQSLNVVAYEAIRAAARNGSQTPDVLARANEVIAERKLVQARVQLIPPLVESVSRGEPVKIRVTAPADAEVRRMDYLALVHPETLEDVGRIQGPTLAAVAAYVGPARLIDNEFIEP